MGKARRNRYSAEYKAEAIRLVRSTSEPLAKVARDLGVLPETLRLWVQAARPPSEVPLTDEERGELKRLRREVRELADGARHPKKSHRLLRQAERVTVAFIAAEKACFPIRVLCRALEVSPSGYYAAQHRPVTARATRDTTILRRLHVLHAESRQTYGRPRLRRALRQEGLRVGDRRVRRLMRLGDLVARGRRRYRVTTDSAHQAPVARNHLARAFAVARPNRVWAADITAVWTTEGWLYLAVLLDLVSRRVVGWAAQDTMETDLPLAALRQALAWRRVRRGLLHHSDRGVQYASARYQALLQRHGVRVSMSRKGNCWDNSVVESFFRTLKTELHPMTWSSRAQARTAIANYIEGFYNARRLHSTLDYRSPADFEARFKVAV